MKTNTVAAETRDRKFQEIRKLIEHKKQSRDEVSIAYNDGLLEGRLIELKDLGVFSEEDVLALEAEDLGKQVAALAPTTDGTPTRQILIVQDSLEVIASARAVIAAMADSLSKIIVRDSDTAALEKARETAVASGQLKAMQRHGLLSMEKYSELMLEKSKVARNTGA